MKIFGKEIIEPKVIDQLENCMTEDSIGVLTADAHYGYSHPIGGAIAYKDKISLSGVGFDIGCGNFAVRTEVNVKDIDIKKIMDELVKTISFGMGRNNNEPVDHQVLDKIANTDFLPQRNLLDLARNQLGTVGSGNHFIDIFKDGEDMIWIGLHFGSRGFGHKTTTGFISMSQGFKFGDAGKQGTMDSKPILFDTNSDIGQNYLGAVSLAGEYAMAGREVVMNKVLSILDNPGVTFSVHNHHNFVWKENHFGEDYWVVRKGCTPAFPGQYGFIGANMFDQSVIIRGVDCVESKEGLYSTVHGAGRIMSRTQAAGKKKWRRGEDGKTTLQRTEGKVNFEAVKRKMEDSNIELRGAGADESPECYNLDEVLMHHSNTIEIMYRLTPIGVAMAGEETVDPYKD